MVVTAREFVRVAINSANDDLPVGATTNAALACELMLKALSQMEQGSFLRSHNLAQLFDDLPTGIKDATVSIFAAMASADGEDIPDPESRLHEMVEGNQSTFVDVRYLFEKISGDEILEREPVFPIMRALWVVTNEKRKAHGLRAGRHVLKELDED